MNISSIRYRWRDALLRLSADQLGLLFLWISLLIQARFESQRWLRALESGALQPVRREQILIVLSLVTFVGQMVTWACYVWYGWKVGWQPTLM